MRSGRFLEWTLSCVLACSDVSALAADGASPEPGTRDPTQMPPVLQQSVGPAAKDSSSEAPAQAFFIMSQGGRLTVIHQAHRLHVGDELDNARIVRIENNAVWLREGGQVKKVSIYPDVTIKFAPAQSASSRQGHRRPRTTKKDVP